MLTRSKTPKLPLSERNNEPEVNEELIILTYPGKIIYETAFEDTAAIADTLLTTLVANTTQEFIVFGFDLEWPFSFTTGPGIVATMQLCSNFDSCYIFHFSGFPLNNPVLRKGSIPYSLLLLLAHPKVRLVGVNIKCDIKKLYRDFKCSMIKEEDLLNNCIELSTLANGKLSFKKRWSLQGLVNYLMKKEIIKDKKVRMSKWNVVPLTIEQQVYAAIDAFASLDLYFIINKLDVEIGV